MLQRLLAAYLKALVCTRRGGAEGLYELRTFLAQKEPARRKVRGAVVCGTGTSISLSLSLARSYGASCRTHSGAWPYPVSQNVSRATQMRLLVP